MSEDPGADRWRRCSSCKKPIAFGAAYYVCNVSTCNRGSKGFVFCTVSCWDAHLGIVRHRESWAEDARAPTRAEYERGQKAASGPATPGGASRTPAPRTNRETAPTRERRRIVPPASRAESDAELPREILIVVSKLKKYVKAKSGMNCSDRVGEPLSAAVRALCDEAIERARADERKTLLERDFEKR